MQPPLSSHRQQVLRAIRDRLGLRFGPIRDAERLDPMSQFALAFIGARTQDEIAAEAFRRLRARYPCWDEVADAPVEGIAAALADVAFPESKAQNLKQALRQLRARAGALDLDFLAELPVETALFWLEQIDGVGRTIAAATLNFSTLRRRAFVVDPHGLRVLRRFGVVASDADVAEAYDAVMTSAEELDADALYALHWYLNYLGQERCTDPRALCVVCPLAEFCLMRIERDVIAVLPPSGNAA